MYILSTEQFLNFFYFCPALTKLALDLHVNLCLFVCLCVFPVFIPSHPIFDKFIFDKVLIMLTSLPPLEFLTKL